MWDMIRRAAAVIRLSPSGDDSYAITEILHEALGGRMTADEAAKKLSGVRSISAYYRDPMRYTADIPNTATAFAVYAVNGLYDAVRWGDTALVQDIAYVLSSLPERDMLRDAHTVHEINRVYITPLNTRYGRHILPEIAG